MTLTRTRSKTLQSILLALPAFIVLAAEGGAQPNTQFQPRPPFQNQPASPCSFGPISQSVWKVLGSVYTQENEKLDVDVNDTTIQAMNYFTRALNRAVLYIKVMIQFRNASVPGRDRTETVMLDGRGHFVLISRRGPMADPYYLTEGALRQDVDRYLQPIPSESAYSMLEEHLRNARCF
jgi:hypothetical protein